MDISIRPGLNIENKQDVVHQHPDQRVYPYHQIIVYILDNVPYVLIYDLHIQLYTIVVIYYNFYMFIRKVHHKFLVIMTL